LRAGARVARCAKLVALVALGGLSACRSTEVAADPSPAEPQRSEAQAPSEPAAVETAAERDSSAPRTEAQPTPPRTEAPPTMPACGCAPTPPIRKPHALHKRKHHKPRKELKEPAEPASASPQPPPGGVINADVGQIGSSLMSILGKDVHGPKGENLGRVVDVLADANGAVRVAVIDFGGFLGVGTRRIAVDWPLLRFDPAAGDKAVILNVSREKLQSAPEYKDSNRPRVLMPPPDAARTDAADAARTTK
jgi:hypothetical protein